MPTTLSNGVVVPSPGDQVPANGVQAFRDQGASVNAALGARALVGHSHAIADVTGLQAALDNAGGTPSWELITGKPAAFPPSAHTHAWGEVTGKPSTFPPAAHTHAVADVAGLQAILDALPSTTIASPEDLGTRSLNLITDPGYYTQPFASRSTLASNYPYEGMAGVLEVMHWRSGGIIQRWTSQMGGVSTRYSLSGSWQGWQNLRP